MERTIFQSHVKNPMMKTIKNTALLAVSLFLSFNTVAQSSKDVVEVASGSQDHTTLVQALKAADLVSTLQGTGPFTVFGPTNKAFSNLPSGTLDNLLLPENKTKLATILTYHVVAGNLDKKAVLEAIKNGKGKAVLTTLQGGKLTATIVKGNVVLTDENGGMAMVTITNLDATNGVIHVIDKVLMPK